MNRNHIAGFRRGAAGDERTGLSRGLGAGPCVSQGRAGGLRSFAWAARLLGLTIISLSARAEIPAPDNLLYGHKLWADVNSGMLVKAKTFNEKREAIEQFRSALALENYLGPQAKQQRAPQARADLDAVAQSGLPASGTNSISIPR